MKKLLLSLIVAFAMTATAQNKIELTSMGKYHQFKKEVTKARAKAAPGSKEKTVGVLVEMNQGYTVGQLEGKVQRIAFDRGTLGKVYVTLSQLDQLNTLAEVKRIAFEQKLQKRLDKAAPAMKTDLVHQGADGLPQQFTGKDVMVVVYDDGFDPNHPMFLDADGKSRVLAVVTKNDKDDEDFVVVEDDEIASFTTDSEEESHGCHVAGIAAGKYTDGNIHLEGSAPDANIIFICSELVNDSEMADMVGKLRKSLGKPVVVNISLGDNSGMHSDKSIACMLLDEVAEKDSIIFCIAAGNEGEDNIVQRKELSGSADEMKSFVMLPEWQFNYMDDIYFEGKGAHPFKVTPVVFDWATGTAADTLKATTGNIDGEYVEDEREYIIGNSTIKLTTKVDARLNTTTGNYETLFNYNLENSTESLVSLYIGYIVTGIDGEPTTVTAYVGTNSTLGVVGNEDWQEDITTDGTINTLACGNHTIAVGNYITRYLTTETKGFDDVLDPTLVKDGDMEPSSSWGTLYDGRSFPHIAAPGTNVISSINSYNTEESDPDVTYYSTTSNGRDYHFTGYTGTSMATPAMTGVVALWLEADPTLTVDKVRTIAMETAIVDDNVRNATFPVQFGAGKIDALAGLKRVLAEAPTTVKELNERSGKNILIELKGDRIISVFAANETQLNATLYTADGRKVSETFASGNTLDINAPSAGVYVLKVGGQKSSAVRKVVVE
ncbi:MAG: S8 family peptidase [Prevotella sp.]